MKENMNILICINRKFLMPAIVMIESLFENNNTSINVFVIHSDINEADSNKLINHVQNWDNRNDKKITMIKIDDSFLTHINSLQNMRWPKEVYYRLFASYVIPNNIDKILYLDADIIVDKEIIEFYKSKFYDNYFIACEDPYVTSENNYSKRLNIPDSSIYFNSGVLLMNLAAIRTEVEFNDITETILKYSNEFIFPDQDLLNKLFYQKVSIKDFRKYNFMCDATRYTRKQFKQHTKHAAIFHFGGGENFKPWSYKYHGTLKSIWWKYAVKTEYKNDYTKFKIANTIYQPLYYFKMLRLFFNELRIHVIHHLRRFYQ